VSSELPYFPYHRDPVASRSIRQADTPCECCGQSRGVLYRGVTYSKSEVEALCPWCIASGAAADKYDATFFDAHFCDNAGDLVDLPERFHRAVFDCTIGFSTFNPIGWWVHCGEPAEYVTRIEPYEMVFQCKKCGEQHSIHDMD
jgi:uncharacterized protein CbrC (UPF0167 family)